MNRVFSSVSIFLVVFCLNFTAQANSMLSNPCSFPLDSPNYESCKDKAISDSFNYEQSIWTMDKEAPFLALMDDTRYPEDPEWQSMDISDKVKNESRNKCALSNKNDCIIFDKD